MLINLINLIILCDTLTFFNYINSKGINLVSILSLPNNLNYVIHIEF